MYEENNYDPYDAAWLKWVEEQQAIEEAQYEAYYKYFDMSDDVLKAASPAYTFVGPKGEMSYREYLIWKQQSSIVMNEGEDLPF